MPDRVLITGGAGFIGAHLARRLLADGHEVTLADDFSRGVRDREFIEIARHAELIEADLTRPWTGPRLNRSYDAVYHLAAVVGVANVMTDPARTLRVGVACALRLADWCRVHEPTRLFFSSTSEVSDGAGLAGIAPYPLAESVPFVLQDPWSPRSAYALGKAAGEAILAHLGGTTQVRVGRYHNVYGPRMGMSHVVPELIARLMHGDDPLPLPGMEQRRAFCYVSDAVEATLRLMALPGAAPLVLNIGSDLEEVTIGELAGMLCSITGRHPTLTALSAPPGSPSRRLPDLTGIRALTGFNPEVPLGAGLRLTYDWYASSDDHRLATRGQP